MFLYYYIYFNGFVNLQNSFPLHFIVWRIGGLHYWHVEISEKRFFVVSMDLPQTIKYTGSIIYSVSTERDSYLPSLTYFNLQKCFKGLY